MSSITATQARKEFFDLVKDAVTKHKVFHIHHRQGDAVLMSEEEYESLLETLELLSIPGFRERLSKSLKQIEKGQTYSLNEAFKNSK